MNFYDDGDPVSDSTKHGSEALSDQIFYKVCKSGHKYLLMKTRSGFMYSFLSVIL